MARLPLLEMRRADADLTDDEAQALVAFTTAWSDHWASSALDWVDQGVWSEDVAAALRLCAKNKTYSQATRHRAWAYVKPRR
jgi:kynurenine formamidase